MVLPVSYSLPIERLRRLEFLLGESAGLMTLYPPGLDPVKFQVHLTASWETCQRYVTMDLYAEIPGIGRDTHHAAITYSQEADAYRMWSFESSHDEPTYLEGNFDGDSLALLSKPIEIFCGVQRLRYVYTPRPQGAIELIIDRWELDGYVRHAFAVVRPHDRIDDCA